MSERKPRGAGSGFEWYTEVETDAELVMNDPGTQKTTRRRRFWLLIVVVALTVLAGLLYVRAARQIDEAEDVQAADIQANFNLVREADSRQDLELLDNVMSARDSDWRTAHLALLERGLLFDRQGFGLEYVGPDPEAAEVTFSPDFRSAWLAGENRYLWFQAPGISQTIQLRPTYSFQRSDRWLWSPPDEEFWGAAEDETEVGRFLSVTFPPRDRVVGLRLAEDLDQLLAQLCGQEAPIHCPGARKLELVLSRAPETLVDVTLGAQEGKPRLVVEVGWPRGYELELPTPTLVGLPEDELAYQALRRGYGRYLVRALAEANLEPNCCGSPPLRQAAIKQLLVEAGLQSLPEAKLSTTLSAQDRPAQDIVQLCSRADGQTTELLAYSFADSIWTELMVPRIHVDEVRPAPGQDGLLLRSQDKRRLAGFALPGYVSTVYWWRQGGAQEVAQWRHYAPFARWDVRDEALRLLARRTSTQTDIGAFFVFDLRQCGRLGCEREFLGRARGPAWSPDGGQVLYSGPQLVWRRANGVDEPIGPGIAPFWISVDEYGYVRTDRQRQLDVVTVKLPGGVTTPVINHQELLQAIPTAERPEEVVIGQILPSPADRDSWLLLAFAKNERQPLGAAMLFQYSRQDDALQLLLRSARLNSFSLSPDGRRLAVLANEPEDSQWLLGIFDLAGGQETRAYTLPADRSELGEAHPWLEWSSDATWLLLASGGQTHLVNPSFDRPIHLTPPSAGCVSAVWMNHLSPTDSPSAN